MALSERHAAQRLAERYLESEVDFTDLKKYVEERRYTSLAKQTCTRSICMSIIGQDKIFFILNRQTGSIVTVLTEDQVRLHLTDAQLKLAGLTG